MHAKTFFLLTLLTFCFGDFKITQKIDDWGATGQPLVLLLDRQAPPEVSVESTVISGTVLGGERDIELVAEEGSIGSLSSVVITANELNFAAPGTMSGRLVVQYDGRDESSQLNRNGLNGFDLTTENGDRFRVKMECDVGATVIVYVYSESGVSSKSFFVPGLEGLKDFILPFENFDGNADFSRVGAIEILVPFVVNLDLGIEEFDVLAEVTPNGGFEFVRPVDELYIDYDIGCERKVQDSFTTTTSFSSSSDSSLLLPAVGLLLTLLLL